MRQGRIIDSDRFSGDAIGDESEEESASDGGQIAGPNLLSR